MPPLVCSTLFSDLGEFGKQSGGFFMPAPFGSSSIIYAISVFQFLRLLSALVT